MLTHVKNIWWTMEVRTNAMTTKFRNHLEVEFFCHRTGVVKTLINLYTNITFYMNTCGNTTEYNAKQCKHYKLQRNRSVLMNDFPQPDSFTNDIKRLTGPTDANAAISAEPCHINKASTQRINVANKKSFRNISMKALVVNLNNSDIYTQLMKNE